MLSVHQFISSTGLLIINRPPSFFIINLLFQISFILLHGLTGLDGKGGIYFFQVSSPAKLKYTYEVRLARDIGVEFGSIHRGLKLVSSQPPHACSPIQNTQEIYGQCALVDRGQCSFLSKTLAVEAAGGLCIVVTDTENGDEGMVEMISDETGREAYIPALYLPGIHGRVFQSHSKYSNEPVIIDIPLNLSMVPLNEVRKPPWDLW